MGASETNSTGRGESPGAERRSPCAGVRVLLVTSRSGVQRRLVKLLGKRVDALSVSKTVLDARKRLSKGLHDLALIDTGIGGGLGELCNDLVEAYRELSDQFEDVSVSAELTSLLRQELDVESLLRTLLEYTLAKVGSTNAAIFLPSTSGEFSLGAYVNYDCPKDSAEVMMDHLANVMAPRFEHQDRVLAMSGSADLERYLGEDAHWLGESTAMVIACREDDECLAVITLFRDKRTPFGENDVKMLSIIAEHFGSQLSRVIHVHHRHLPKDQWGGFETDLDDEDEGFGDIDLAA